MSTPPPSDPRDSSPESLFAAWLAQRELGADADLELLCREHAEAAERLRDLHRGFEELERLRRRFGLAGSLSQRLGSLYGSQVDPRIELADEEPADFTSQFLDRLVERIPSSSRYSLKGEIASGGMGAILRVWDEDLRRHLAMKVVLGRGGPSEQGSTPPIDRRLLARFLEEAQVTGQLDHPGIVPVHELGLDAQGRVFFTMKLVQGRDLKAVFELMRRGEEGWTQVKVLGVLHRVCEAMSFAHDKGVVHRDLKPANVMVGRYGEVYVMDWGLAKVRGRDDERDVRVDDGRNRASEPVQSDRLDASDDSPLRTMDGDVLGTPAYMPPEQALGKRAEIGPSSDIYAVGAMLYHLLAGRMPFTAEGERVTNLTLLRRLREGPPNTLSEVAGDAPPELVAICNKAMAREAGSRYADMAALAADLAAFLEGRVVRAFETGTWAEARKWVQRNRGWAASLAAALVVVLGLAAFHGVRVSGKNNELRLEQRQTEAANEQLRAAIVSLEAETARATQASREAQRNLADSLVREATIAGTRGRWRDVLELLGRARSAGFPDEVGLQLDEAWACLALLQRDRAKAIVDELAQRQDLGEHRGRLLLLRGDLALREPLSAKEAEPLLRAALKETLRDADRAYAEGLLAETTPQTLAAFEEAIRLDPFHFRALGQALQIHALLGHREETAARERAFRELCPEDPMPDAVAALVAGLRGDPQRAQEMAEQVRSKSGPETGAAMTALVSLALDLSAGSTLERLIGAGDGTVVAALALGQTEKLKRMLSSLPTDALLLPSVRAGLAAAAEAVTSMAFAQLTTPDKLQARLETALERHPDGLFLYFQGANALLSPSTNSAGAYENLRSVEEFYRLAAETTSVLPHVQRASKYYAAYSQVLLARGSAMTDGYRRRFARNVFELCVEPDLLEAELALLAGEAIGKYEDPLLGLVLLRRWQELPPTQPGYPMLLARALIQAGAFERAVMVLDGILTADPWNDEAGSLRDTAISSAREMLARLE